MQNVDLLTDDLRPKREPFSLRDLLLLWAGFLLVLLLWSAWHGYGWWQVNGDRVRIAAQVEEVATLNQQLERDVNRPPDAGLQHNVAQLQAARREQALLKELLAGVATSDGFSARLTDLARFKVDGLWLQSFSFAAGSAQIRLSGYSENPANVPLFLAGLSEGPGFSGYSFDGFELREGDNNLVEFEVYGPVESQP